MAFDLDDTLNGLRFGMHRALKRRGFFLPIAQWHTFDLHSTVGMSVQDFQSMLIEDRLLEEAAIEPQGAAAIRELLEFGFDVEVWTARGFHPRASKITSASLGRHGLGHLPVVLIEHGRSKRELLAQRTQQRPLHAFIDDNGNHVRDIAAAAPGCQCFLIDRPWNRSHHGLRRVRSARDAANALLDAAA